MRFTIPNISNLRKAFKNAKFPKLPLAGTVQILSLLNLVQHKQKSIEDYKHLFNIYLTLLFFH